MPQPYVSIIFPILNEVQSLSRAIETLILKSSYPQGRLEVLLIDGGSTDGSVELIKSLCEENENFRFINNSLATTPHALNLGIKHARHKIILRADAHAVFYDDYISSSVDLLISKVGDNIGGHLKSVGNKSMFSQILAAILNSPLGNGGAGYKSNSLGRTVDTVWCGCWFKDTLESVGGFDPLWVTNQDAELNARLRSKGYTVYCSPDIKASLVVRNDYPAFIKQYFRYGKGRTMTLIRYPEFIKCLLSLALIQPVLSVTLLFFLAILAVIKAGSGLSVERKISTFLWALPILIGMNFAWVFGAFNSAFRICISRDLRSRIVIK